MAHATKIDKCIAYTESVAFETQFAQAANIDLYDMSVLMRSTVCLGRVLQYVNNADTEGR